MYQIKLNKNTQNLTLKKVLKSIKLEQNLHKINLQQTGRVGPQGPQGEPGESAAAQGAMGAAIHLNNPNYPRPNDFTVVYWIGSVEPTNSVDNDIWVNIT